MPKEYMFEPELDGFCNSDWTDDILTLVVRDD